MNFFIRFIIILIGSASAGFAIAFMFRHNWIAFSGCFLATMIFAALLAWHDDKTRLNEKI